MITVKVSELLEKAQELLAAGYEYVDVEEMEAEEDLPKCLHFSAHDDLGIEIDFEDIDHIEA